MFDLSHFMTTESPEPLAAGSVVAALDMGSSKIACLIGRVTDRGGVHVIGAGLHVAKGIKGGRIVDMPAAAQSMMAAVQSAEKMADTRIEEIHLSLPSHMIETHIIEVQGLVRGGIVTQKDLQRLYTQCRQADCVLEAELIQLLPLDIALDGQKGIENPIGMKGHELVAQLCVLTADNSKLTALEQCLALTRLEVEAYCCDVYAASLSSLIEDERDLGCVLVDMGAETTGVSIFLEGALVHCDHIPVGGQHVTRDIASGLTTPLNHAERLKNLYGFAIQSSIDGGETIEVPQIGADESEMPPPMPRSMLTSIIQPRMEEVFELVRASIDDSEFAKVLGRRVVVTGGASQMNGLSELATLIISKQIRIAPKPKGVTGLPEMAMGPAFMTAAGLLIYGARHRDEMAHLMSNVVTPKTLIAQAWHWVRENW